MVPSPAATALGFLDDAPLMAWRPESALPSGLAARGVARGGGNPALEVLVLDAVGTAPPRAGALRAAWEARNAGRAAPLVVAALHEDGRSATLCGATAEALSVLDPLPAEHAERVCREALARPDRHAALDYLNDAFPALRSDADLPGLRNEGLLTDHVLREAAARAAGGEADRRGRAVQDAAATDEALLRALGFGVERLDSLTAVLRVGGGAEGAKRAVAVLLRPEEREEATSERFQRVSPVAYALHKAEGEGLPWVVTVQGGRVRLYPSEAGVGVGRRGRTDTWVEARTDFVRPGQAALLWLVFSAPALARGGTAEALLRESKDFAADLATRLRERIYDAVVPRLAAAVAEARGLGRDGRPVPPDALRLTHAMAVTILFRLLFVTYAEDRGLLPYRTNAAYAERSLKRLARRLHDDPRAPPGPGARLWGEVGRLFAAVRGGDPQLGVPAYGGGLFEDDPSVSEAGAALAGIALPDAAFEPALRALLLDAGDGLARPSAGPVDFRSLRVREFGTIYEGLLESELAVAPADLALRRAPGGGDAVYAPARAGEAVAVARGAVYLHDRSGARKASGSYFTPSFAVEHLLDAALAPALAAHAARVRAAADEAEAAEAFFDLRVADLAMGSGHFLVAAVDRVEAALAALLVERDLPRVRAELADLRAAARAALGPLADGAAGIEDSGLLRRQVALRCLYGVDLNPLAVELARLSVWVHTFVPGLPLALLDDHLVHGNALVGVGTVRQIEERFAATGTALFPVDAHALLGDAAEPLRRRARLADSTVADVARARDAVREAKALLGPTRALCDIVAGQRVAGERAIPFQYEHWPRLRGTIQSHPALRKSRKELAGLHAFHFPVEFPEVFLRRNPGFDVILGNPPWEKVKVEEHAFWARHVPGLRGLSAREREARLARLPGERPDLAAELAGESATAARLRAVLGADPSLGRGGGDPDLYRAFAWRLWHLAAGRGGRVGVVLPRAVAASLGMEDWRRAVLAGSAEVEVTTVTNRNGWMFPEVHPQFTVALVALARGEPGAEGLSLRGPYASEAAWRVARASGRAPGRFAPATVLGWTSSASLPMLPGEDSLALFARLREAPRLDLQRPGEWRARPDTELHATADKGLMTFGVAPPEGAWPVMKGESFDTWANDLGPGSYYAWVADPEAAIRALQASRVRGLRSARDTAHAEFPAEHRRDPATLACHRPRVAFRDVSRATDTRTVRAALVPPRVFLAHQAPYLLWPSGDERDEAYLLGVLCSVPLDWYARRFVENHLTYAMLNPLPVPRPGRDDPDRRRVVALAGRLAAADARFADWAAAVGVAHGPLDPAEKAAAVEALDAAVARLYRLTPAMLARAFDTFHAWPTEAAARAWAARRDRTVALLAGPG